MKLQIALDDITLEAAAAWLEDVANYVDIIEAGTPLMLEYGMEAVRTIRKLCPDKEILCDAKIMDGGALEANAAFRAGADYVTVLGVADTATIGAVAKVAREWKKSAVVDLLCVDDFAERIPILRSLAVDILAVHVGVDQQAAGRTPLSDLICLQSIAGGMKVAVAGGIDNTTLADYLEHKPDVVVVGSAICNAANPANEAKRLYERIQRAKP